MKKFLLLCACGILLTASSCKKVCYDCNQYCSYCVLKSNPDVAQKFCANKFSAQVKVDSIYHAFLMDTSYECNLLKNEKIVCDNKNASDEAISYYLKQDYYCNPK